MLGSQSSELSLAPTVVLTVAHSTVASRDLCGAIDVVSCELSHLVVQLVLEISRQGEPSVAIIWILFESYARLHILTCIPRTWLESAQITLTYSYNCSHRTNRSSIDWI